MKKTLCLFLAFVFLFASCNQNSKTNNSTKNDIEINECSGVPMVVYATLDELKEIKNAFDDMKSDEFYEYMKNEKSEQFISGMRDYERTKELLDELTETTVTLLDGDEDNFSEIGFYWERNEVQQLISFDENSRISVYSYTPKSGRTESSFFGANNKKAVLLKEIKCDGVSVFIYKTDNEESFFADAFVDGTCIFMRTKHIGTIDEIEECFARLEFVKIGDLLDVNNIGIAQTENISQAELSDEKVTSEAEFVTTQTNTGSELSTEDFSGTETTE